VAVYIQYVKRIGSMFLAPNYSVFPPTEILDKNAMSKTPLYFKYFLIFSKNNFFFRIGCKRHISKNCITNSLLFYSFYLGVNDKSRLFTTWVKKPWVLNFFLIRGCLKHSIFIQYLLGCKNRIVGCIKLYPND